MIFYYFFLVNLAVHSSSAKEPSFQQETVAVSPTSLKSFCSDSDSPVVHRQNKPGLSALRHKLSQSFRKSRTCEVELDDSNAYGKESCLECKNVCTINYLIAYFAIF